MKIKIIPNSYTEDIINDKKEELGDLACEYEPDKIISMAQQISKMYKMYEDGYAEVETLEEYLNLLSEIDDFFCGDYQVCNNGYAICLGDD